MREYVERLRRGECGYSHEGLLSLDWRGQDLKGCDLQGLNLRGLDISGANLCEANLSEADLRGADLRGANLCFAILHQAYLPGANLSGANLSKADLRWANLSGADLRKADLREVNLYWANLSKADLRGADLREADLREADLSEADLSGVILNWDKIPLVPNIDAAVLKAIELGGNLDMQEWHTCKTTHCRAGWVITIAGEHGKALEEQLGTNAAAALICARSGSHPVPNWYADNKTALNDIKARAKRPTKQQLRASRLRASRMDAEI